MRCDAFALRLSCVVGAGEHAKVSACKASSTRTDKNARPSTSGKTGDATVTGRRRVRILPLEGFCGSRTEAVSWLEAISLAFPEHHCASGFSSGSHGAQTHRPLTVAGPRRHRTGLPNCPVRLCEVGR